jgi:hypothetical protein
MSPEIAAYFQGLGQHWLRLAEHAQGTGGVFRQASEAIGIIAIPERHRGRPRNGGQLSLSFETKWDAKAPGSDFKIS